MNAPIPIVDDDIDEANQQFIVELNVLNAVDPATLTIGRDVATSTIQDDDGESELLTCILLMLNMVHSCSDWLFSASLHLL